MIFNASSTTQWYSSTNLSTNAGLLTGTIPSAVLGASSLFLGTTSVALNRASLAQALTGITSIDGSAATLTTTRAIWGQNFNGSAAISGALTGVGNITGTAGITLTATAAALGLVATGANSITATTNGTLRLTIDSAGASTFAGPVIFSTTATVTAGTNAQGQGALTADFNLVTTAAANPSGVTLPTAAVGRFVAIANRGANPIAVFPASGSTSNNVYSSSGSGASNTNLCQSMWKVNVPAEQTGYCGEVLLASFLWGPMQSQCIAQCIVAALNSTIQQGGQVYRSLED
jgi:hypothetical protein